MADITTQGNSVAPLRNVIALMELIERVQNRAFGLPGMAVFYGPSGYGKTTAATWCANRFRAYQVQVKSVWTKKKLCEAILTDMGIQPARTIADMVDQIAGEMARSGRPLLIDEADHLVNKGLIEMVRDIYESSMGGVILIGEERMPASLQRWERIHNRMLDWVGAEPADLEDAENLARIWCPGVELSEDLLASLLDASNRSIRRVCVNLDRVLEFARTNGLARVTRADWGKTDFFTGRAPASRKVFA